MPGPKMPRPSSDSAASTIAMASSIVGWLPPKPAVNSPKSVEPMPTMTASTRTLMPEADDIAEHALGEERGLAEEREGDEHEAGERRQLELDERDEELDGEDEEGEEHDRPGEHQDGDLHEVLEEGDIAHEAGDRLKQRPAGLEADLGDTAGPHEIVRRDAGAGGGEAEAGKALEDDAGEEIPVADQVGEEAEKSVFLTRRARMSSSAPQAQKRRGERRCR